MFPERIGWEDSLSFQACRCDSRYTPKDHAFEAPIAVRHTKATRPKTKPPSNQRSQEAVETLRLRVFRCLVIDYGMQCAIKHLGPFAAE